MSAPAVSQTGFVPRSGFKKQWQEVWRRLKRNRLAVAGLIIVIAITLVAILAPIIAPYSPTKINLRAREAPVGSSGHWLGTDEKGRDLLSRIIYGARLTMIVGVSSIGLAVVAGISFGLAAGYYPRLDGPIMRFMDLMFAFPGILLALTIVAILGPSLFNVVIAIAVWSVPGLARIVRGSVLSIKEMEYITAIRSCGASDLRILFGHILPNAMAPIIVYCTMRLGRVIISTAALSYLGLGAQPPTPEWGAMIAAGRNYIYSSPHISVVPGVAIMCVVFSCNVLGDGLRDALDPNLSQ
jgi:peptide/nickel transport system permease protein